MQAANAWPQPDHAKSDLHCAAMQVNELSTQETCVGGGVLASRESSMHPFHAIHPSPTERLSYAWGMMDGVGCWKQGGE